MEGRAGRTWCPPPPPPPRSLQIVWPRLSVNKLIYQRAIWRSGDGCENVIPRKPLRDNPKSSVNHGKFHKDRVQREQQHQGSSGPVNSNNNDNGGGGGEEDSNRQAQGQTDGCQEYSHGSLPMNCGPGLCWEGGGLGVPTSLFLAILVLALANSSLRVWGISGSNRTP